MARLPAHALTLARPAIRLAMALNLLYGLALVSFFIASFVIADWPVKPLGYDPATMHAYLPWGLRAVELLGLVLVGLVFVILRRLLAIVDSVRAGDPFVQDNAARLQTIAWCLLGVELLRLAVFAIGEAVGIHRLGSAGFSVVPWLAILTFFIASFVIPDWPAKPLGYDPATMHAYLPMGLRTVEVLGLVLVGLVFLILRRLLAIVDSVRAGDPFVIANAERLQTIAWCLLGVELLRLAVTAISSAVDIHKLGSAGWSVVPWLAILLLFVLARVFMHGARMRSDLEGTV